MISSEEDEIDEDGEQSHLNMTERESSSSEEDYRDVIDTSTIKRHQ